MASWVIGAGRATLDPGTDETGSSHPAVGRYLKRTPSEDELMDDLLDVVSQEAAALDLVLHRATTLQLLVATGRTDMVERAAHELDSAVDALEALTAQRNVLLARAGHRDLAAAAGAAGEAGPALLVAQQRLRSNAEATKATAAAVERSAGGAARKVERALAGEPIDLAWRGYGPRRSVTTAGTLLRAEV
jgi:hypothetical protein